LAIRRSQTLSIVFMILWLALPSWAADDASDLEKVDASQVVAGVAQTSPAADPADDPWLAEEGPAVPVSVETEEEQVIAKWWSAPPTPEARTAAVRRVRLELGLGDLLPPAITLLRSASEEEPEINALLARDLAPGVPAIQIATAGALWQGGDTGAAIHALIDAIVAGATHIEAQLWWVENLALVLVLVILGTSIAFIALSALMVFPHAAHDLGDLFSGRTPDFARSAGLAALILLPLAIGEGVVGVVLVLFAISFTYGKSLQRNALVMAAVLFLVGLYPTAQLASVTTTLLDRDPILNSVLAVANGIETRADVERLEAASDDDLAAAHALAYRARRYGLSEASLARLDRIAVDHPSDPVMLANRGNIEMRRGQTDEAIAYYRRSATLVDSPTVLFDLSQAYAAAFRMDEVDATLERAQALDDEEVSDLSSLGDATLVADVGLPFGHFQNHLMALALAQKPASIVAETLAPGRLGGRWFMTASAFAVAALLSLLLANRFDQASVCSRCGHRICTRCEDTVWSEELCEDCHHLFQNPEDTDPSLRMARLQALSRREVRIDRIWVAASLLIPGAAGFASKRPDLAMLGLLLFGWAATWLIWPRGILVDPLLMGSAAWIGLAVPGGLAMIAYVGVVLANLAARKNL
jgi:tetratricopeptide (TPR) repeat protein